MPTTPRTTSPAGSVTSWTAPAAATTTPERTSSSSTASCASPSTSATSPSAASRRRCKLGFVVRAPGGARARGPRQPRRQRRDPRARVGAGRARQRLLARARRPQPTARSCTGCGGSSSARAWLDQRVKEGELDVALRRRAPHLRLRPARPRRRADRAGARALLGPRRLPAAAEPTLQPAARARALAIASAPASPTSSSGAQRAAAPRRSSAGKRRARGAAPRRAR